MNNGKRQHASDSGSPNERPLHFTDQLSADEVLGLLSRSARA